MNMDAIKFHLGDTVYLAVNAEQKGMVTGIVFRPMGCAYYVTFADGQERTHYEIELTTEKAYYQE